MQIEVKLPQMTEDDADIVIDEFTVAEGDQVSEGDAIAVVTAGKASGLEVVSTASGTISKLQATAGDTVDVGAVLVVIEAGAGASAPTPAPSTPEPSVPEPAPADPPPAEPPAATSAPAPAPTEPSVAVTPAPTPTSPTPAPPVATTPAPVSTAPPVAASGAHVPAGPAIRQLARELGVEIGQVQGTGPNGRITREDLMEVVRAANQTSSASAAAQRDDYGPVRVEKMSGVRKTIAKQMVASWTSVPRVTNFDDADVTELEQMRQSSKADYAQKGIKLTTMPFLIKAVAMSLQDHPVINASLDLATDSIVYKEYVNIGIAIDTDAGLVVASLEAANEKSISEIAHELSEIANKVRDGDFAGIKLKGSSFTISNLGAIGGTYSTPIVNVPEVAILLAGRSRKMPVVGKNDEVAIRLMMPLSLSYDHRIVDGGAAARFLNEVKGYLQAPSRLLLAP